VSPHARAAAVRRPSGFTLIEVVIAFSILAVGLLAMLAAQVHAMRGGRTGRHTNQAMILARDQMEFLHRLPWTDPILNDTTALAGPPAGYVAPVAQQVTVLSGTGPQVEQSFNLQWRVQNQGLTLKALDVRVSWTEADGRARNHTISSVRHNDP
jgi:prepilin-type N-terminal cleavage/methylation domain-containing protein